MPKTKLYLLILGTVLVISSAILITNIFLFVSSAVEISGTVSQLYYEPGTAQRYVRVSYSLNNSQKEYNLPIGKNHSYRYPIGKQVNLLYDPENPEDVRLNSFWSLWSLELILLGSGLFAWILAFVRKS